MTVTLSDTVLHEKAAPVTDRLERGLIRAMFRLLRETRGVGLAAPQIGIPRRFFITDVMGDRRRVFINPEIIDSSWVMENGLEGCLSVPGMQVNVRRFEWIEIKATNKRGREFNFKAYGFLARCIQHEFDHLEGILITDKRYRK